MQAEQRVEVMGESCLVAAAPDADPIRGFQAAAVAHHPPTLVTRQPGQVVLPTRRQQNYEPWAGVDFLYPTAFSKAPHYPDRRRRVGRERVQLAHLPGRLPFEPREEGRDA